MVFNDPLILVEHLDSWFVAVALALTRLDWFVKRDGFLRLWLGLFLFRLLFFFFRFLLFFLPM